MKSEVIIRNLQSEVIRTGSHKQDYHALTTLTTNEVITTLTPNAVVTPTNAVITPLTTKIS